MKIAVVGGGVSGIVSSFLLSKEHDVTLFEANDYLGGHTNTIPVKTASGTVDVDTGFIVYNSQNYPGFVSFLDQLGVETQDSDMSFGFFNPRENFFYSSVGLSGILAQKRNLFNPKFIHMFYEVKRFNELALSFLNGPDTRSFTLKDFIVQSDFSSYFLDYYLLPMGAAIWSCSYRDVLSFPAYSFLAFWKNHQLLTLGARPTWRTVKGGSFKYVEAFKSHFKGQILLNTPIQRITRHDEGVTIITKEDAVFDYDYVVIATHADQVLKLLAKPTALEKSLFSKWQYSLNHTVLHSDASVMPPKSSAWASWNYSFSSSDASKVSVTYYMNRLQSLSAEEPFLVTLNPYQSIDASKVHKEIMYKHPIFNFDAIETQSKIRSLAGANHTAFCGSYLGHGFHEDAVQSACAVARSFGLSL